MRPAVAADAYAGIKALLRMREKNPTKQMQYTDESTALCHLLDCVKRKLAVVEQGYLIVFDVGRPWYSKENFLLEDLIIRIEPTTAPVQVAIDALSVLATERRCVAVIAGDTQIGYMAPKYLASGFVTLGTQLMKEITHGVAS